MAELIEVDYGKLEEAHKKFRAEADVVTRIIRDIRARMEPLEDGGWKGDAADAFFREMHNEVVPACTRLQKAFSEAATITKQVGQTVQKAEQDATNTFKL